MFRWLSGLAGVIAGRSNRIWQLLKRFIAGKPNNEVERIVFDALYALGFYTRKVAGG